jgi:hypothetical protein
MPEATEWRTGFRRWPRAQLVAEWNGTSSGGAGELFSGGW